MYKAIKRTSGFAFLSFFLSLFSIYDFITLIGPDWLCPITPLFAILFGIVSLRDIKRKNYGGKLFAILGIAFGVLELVIYIPLIISYYG